MAPGWRPGGAGPRTGGRRNPERVRGPEGAERAERREAGLGAAFGTAGGGALGGGAGVEGDGAALTAGWGMQRRIGPSSGCPRCTTQSWLISTRSTRWLLRKVPLVLPRSSRTQASPSTRRIPCRHETRESVMTMSDCGSRPIRYVVPTWNWCTERRVRTTRSGTGEGPLAGPLTWGGAAWASPAGASPAWAAPACGGCRSDQSKRSGGMFTKCRADAPKQESGEPFRLTARFDILRSGHPDTGASGSSPEYLGQPTLNPACNSTLSPVTK